MSETNKLLASIKSNLQQESASRKDEVAVMQSMLNDKEYSVDVYSSNGVEKYCPSADARKMISSVLVNTACLAKDEAKVLADSHEFSKNEAQTFINVSKEFVHSYLSTGRKLPLGGRELSNVSLSAKVVPERVNKRPMKVGKDANGKDLYEAVEADAPIPMHYSVRVSGSCPSWVKNK